MMYRRVILSIAGVVLVGVGLVRLGDEMLAFDQNTDIEFVLRDGDGFASAAKGKAINEAFRSGDWIVLDERATAAFSSAPFDPILLSFRAVARAQGKEVNPRAIAAELDRVALIAGDRPDIVVLRRLALSALLQDRTEPIGTAE